MSLLVMFFFFDSVQVVFTICTAGERRSLTQRQVRAAGGLLPVVVNGPVKRTGDGWRAHRSAFFFPSVLATIAFAFLLLPMCQYLTRPCSPQNK